MVSESIAYEAEDRMDYSDSEAMRARGIISVLDFTICFQCFDLLLPQVSEPLPAYSNIKELQHKRERWSYSVFHFCVFKNECKCSLIPSHIGYTYVIGTIFAF